jgi:AraC-like DNA-binding protein
MSAAHPAAHGERIVEVGVYLLPAQARHFIETPACELTDRILPLADLWGRAGVSLEASIGEARNDDERVGRLELALIGRLKASASRGSAVNVSALAAFVQQRHGAVGLIELADSAGVTRQHLGRMFQAEIGVPPKLFCRLARFRAALAYAARDVKNDGAGMAAELGYTDQSHMIAEFREFSGLTPRPLMLHQRVHPFMEFS